MGKRLTAGALLLLSAGWAGVCAIPATFADTPSGNVAKPSPATGAAEGAEAASSRRPTFLRRAAAPSLFDPARHMRVSEVRAGMKGYGLSVFKGTKTRAIRRRGAVGPEELQPEVRRRPDHAARGRIWSTPARSRG